MVVLVTSREMQLVTAGSHFVVVAAVAAVVAGTVLVIVSSDLGDCYGVAVIVVVVVLAIAVAVVVVAAGTAVVVSGDFEDGYSLPALSLLLSLLLSMELLS